ncbi:MAG TPA: DUF2249 domain-containing protein [Pricia sp.]|nr:DUF2249 domain-containing protein [Pricia sp.]
MEHINANTKISQLIKAHPDALESIIGMDQKFDTLRDPMLRKEIAGRTTIAMAAKMAGYQVKDFYSRLKPLGFEIDPDTKPVVEESKKLPAFITTLNKNQIIDFDVRELLASGNDPLTLILDKVRSVQAGEALKVINTFEPVPLMRMLEKQGFEVYADVISNELVETYFYKKSDKTPIGVKPKEVADSGWDGVMQRFTDKLVTVDVRELEMPQPMLTILSELDKLPADVALFVYHKRIPVFLLPELSDRKFDYRIQEISEGEVHLLIFKN